MSEEIETGFDALPEGVLDAPITAPAQEPEGDDPQPAPPKLTDAEKRAAELAEGQRQNTLHKDDPFIPHPSQELELDAEAALKRQRTEQLKQSEDEARAVESEAAKINRQVYERIYAARNQPAPPPPPPPVVPQAIIDRTKAEMEAGKAATAKHVQQQLSAARKPPTKTEIAAQGSTVPVFQPDTVIRSEVFPESPRLPATPSTDDRKRGVRQV